MLLLAFESFSDFPDTIFLGKYDIIYIGMYNMLMISWSFVVQEKNMSSGVKIQRHDDEFI